MADPASPPEALFRFFEAMQREGPGSDALTRAIFESLRGELPAIPRTADMGCGSGASSLALARGGCQVTAVDIWQPFLDRLNQRSRSDGLEARIETRRASMLESGIAPASLDLIWSEGSLFTVGLEAALAAFAPLLARRGLLVFSECSYLCGDLPDEVRRYWQSEYPAMRSVAGNIELALAAGWSFREARLLPPSAWEDSFYRPMEALMERLGDETGLAKVIASNRREIDLFRRHHASFGYVFYILGRPQEAPT